MGRLHSFTYFKNEYANAHEWLEARISSLVVSGEGADELVSMARTLAAKLDAGDLQEEYESDMDGDGYFKDTGWYSPEMDDN